MALLHVRRIPNLLARRKAASGAVQPQVHQEAATAVLVNTHPVRPTPKPTVRRKLASGVRALREVIPLLAGALPVRVLLVRLILKRTAGRLVAVMFGACHKAAGLGIVQPIALHHLHHRQLILLRLHHQLVLAQDFVRIFTVVGYAVLVWYFRAAFVITRCLRYLHHQLILLAPAPHLILEPSAHLKVRLGVLIPMA